MIDSAKPSPRRLALRVALGTGLLIAALVAGHAVLWRWMGGELEAGFANWAAARRAAGWRVEHGAPLRGGWPLAATLTLPQFRLEGGAATLPGGLAWSADAVMLQLRAPRLDRLAIELPGAHRLRLGGLELSFTADRLFVAVPLARDVPPAEATVTAERLRLGFPAGVAAAVEIGRGEIELGLRSTATESEPALTLRVEAAEVLLPAAPAEFGRALELLRVEIALSGPVPPGRSPAAKAERWRDGGGTVEVRGLELRWGRVAAEATATLTLDEALQPMGAGVLRVSGGAAAIDAAAAARLLAPTQAALGRAALRALERRSQDGGPPEVEIPLTLEGRTLSLARLPLARLPAWVWPAPLPRPAAPDDPTLPPVE